MDMVSDGCVPSLETTGRVGSAVLTGFGSDLASFAYGYGATSIMATVLESLGGVGLVVSVAAIVA